MLQEALWRIAAFADAGADVLFIDALETREEMRALCAASGAAAGLPKVSSETAQSRFGNSFPPSNAYSTSALCVPSNLCMQHDSAYSK